MQKRRKQTTTAEVKTAWRKDLEICTSEKYYGYIGDHWSGVGCCSSKARPPGCVAKVRPTDSEAEKLASLSRSKAKKKNTGQSMSEIEFGRRLLQPAKLESFRSLRVPGEATRARHEVAGRLRFADARRSRCVSRISGRGSPHSKEKALQKKDGDDKGGGRETMRPSPAARKKPQSGLALTRPNVNVNQCNRKDRGESSAGGSTSGGRLILNDPDPQTLIKCDDTQSEPILSDRPLGRSFRRPIHENDNSGRSSADNKPNVNTNRAPSGISEATTKYGDDAGDKKRPGSDLSGRGRGGGGGGEKIDSTIDFRRKKRTNDERGETSPSSTIGSIPCDSVGLASEARASHDSVVADSRGQEGEDKDDDDEEEEESVEGGEGRSEEDEEEEGEEEGKRDRGERSDGSRYKITLTREELKSLRHVLKDSLRKERGVDRYSRGREVKDAETRRLTVRPSDGDHRPSRRRHHHRRSNDDDNGVDDDDDGRHSDSDRRPPGHRGCSQANEYPGEESLGQCLLRDKERHHQHQNHQGFRERKRERGRGDSPDRKKSGRHVSQNCNAKRHQSPRKSAPKEGARLSNLRRVQTWLTEGWIFRPGRNRQS